MQDLDIQLELKKLPTNERQKLVDAFVWLIEQDKIQNPDLYKPNQKEL